MTCGDRESRRRRIDGSAFVGRIAEMKAGSQQARLTDWRSAKTASAERISSRSVSGASEQRPRSHRRRVPRDAASSNRSRVSLISPITESISS